MHKGLTGGSGRVRRGWSENQAEKVQGAPAWVAPSALVQDRVCEQARLALAAVTNAPLPLPLGAGSRLPCLCGRGHQDRPCSQAQERPRSLLPLLHWPGLCHVVRNPTARGDGKFSLLHAHAEEIVRRTQPGVRESQGKPAPFFLSPAAVLRQAPSSARLESKPNTAVARSSRSSRCPRGRPGAVLGTVVTRGTCFQTRRLRRPQLQATLPVTQGQRGRWRLQRSLGTKSHQPAFLRLKFMVLGAARTRARCGDSECSAVSIRSPPAACSALLGGPAGARMSPRWEGTWHGGHCVRRGHGYCRCCCRRCAAVLLRGGHALLSVAQSA